MPVDRTIALSDAVFAVVITLLVLGIEVPEGGALSASELAAVREKLGHQVLVYFVSFWIIAMYWSHHSLLFSTLERMDRKLLVLNFIFLMPVTLLPFVTQLIGARRHEWGVVLVFALANAFAAVAFRVMSRHVVARPDIQKGPETVALVRRLSLGTGLFVGIMTVGVLVSLISVRLGILCFVLVPIVYFYAYVRDPLGRSGS